MRRDAHGTDTGRDTDIEFLAPDSRAFGDSMQADFVGFDGDDAGGFGDDERPRSRWLMAVATVVVCGLIAAGVVAAAPWAGDATVAPTTTAPPPSTAVAVPVTTADIMEGVPVQPAGWVVDDPPADLQFAGAFSLPMPSGQQDPLDVWVERPDDPAAGRWLVVRWVTYHDTSVLTSGGTRLVSGARRMMLSVDGDGVSTVHATVGDDTSPNGIEIRSSGVAPEALVGLVGAVRFDLATDAAIGYGDEAAAATAGLVLAWSGFTSTAGVGPLSEADAGTWFFRPGDGSGMQIEHRSVDRSLLPYMPLLYREVPLGEEVAPEMQAIGRPTRVFSLGSNDTERWHVAVWVDGDQAVSITSFDIDLSATLAAMATARVAADDEWTDLIEQTQRGISFDEGGPSASATLSGTFTDGTTWTGSFSSTYLWIDAAGDGWYTPVRVPDGTEVRQYAGIDIDVVTATARWPEPARTMRVTAGGAPPVDVPMVQVGDGPIFVAMYAQREIGPIEVELVDS